MANKKVLIGVGIASIALIAIIASKKKKAAASAPTELPAVTDPNDGKAVVAENGNFLLLKNGKAWYISSETIWSNYIKANPQHSIVLDLDKSIIATYPIAGNLTESLDLLPK